MRRNDPGHQVEPEGLLAPGHAEGQPVRRRQLLDAARTALELVGAHGVDGLEDPPVRRGGRAGHRHRLVPQAGRVVLRAAQLARPGAMVAGRLLHQELHHVGHLAPLGVAGPLA